MIVVTTQHICFRTAKGEIYAEFQENATWAMLRMHRNERIRVDMV